MVVVISKFAVLKGEGEAVAKAYMERPRLVDQYKGFLGLEVLRPQDKPNEFWLITRWEDESSFKTWFESHKFKESHCKVPDGISVDPSSIQISTFESWCR
jgi:heme oxygenase (mycobilin-producing)